MSLNEKCECDNVGIQSWPDKWYDDELELPYVNHAPHQCRCTNNLRLFERDGKQLLLCSCCFLSTDKLVQHS